MKKMEYVIGMVLGIIVTVIGIVIMVEGAVPSTISMIQNVL